MRDHAKPVAAALNGLLVFTDSPVGADAATTAILVSAPVGRPPPVERPPAGAFPTVGVLAALLLAFAGGIVLYLMPCVLPVLSIKVFALVQHSHARPAQVRMHGVAYAAGVLASFAAIAAALMGLRAAGAEIGWGFQLQSPLFVGVMIYILFAVGLNLSSAFSLGFQLPGVGSDLRWRPGYAGSFCTGALATVVATPCTAPFMASAVGLPSLSPGMCLPRFSKRSGWASPSRSCWQPPFPACTGFSPSRASGCFA